MIPDAWAASSASAICCATANASGERQRAPAHAIVQRVALDQLEHQGRHAAGVFETVDCPDVRMIERREQSRFALEARHAIGVRRERRRQDLQRDVAIQLRVARAIDLAHAAGAEEREDFVGAEARTRGQRHPQRDYSGQSPELFILAFAKRSHAHRPRSMTSFRAACLICGLMFQLLAIVCRCLILSPASSSRAVGVGILGFCTRLSRTCSLCTHWAEVAIRSATATLRVPSLVISRISSSVIFGFFHA